jgi:hypothetical protein
MKSSPEPEFTVSVTGHRNIDKQNTVGVLDCVTQALFAIDRMVHHARPKTRCRLLTALAAGADQICAHALDRLERLCAWETHVMLPFGKDPYRLTLGYGLPEKEAKTAKINFDILLRKANRVIEISDGGLPSETGSAPLHRNWRNRRFTKLGELLARQGDILLAIWRATPSNGPGGTADVVQIALDEGVPVLRLDPDTLKISLLLPHKEMGSAVHMASRKPGHAVLSQADTSMLQDKITKTLIPPFVQ